MLKQFSFPLLLISAQHVMLWKALAWDNVAILIIFTDGCLVTKAIQKRALVLALYGAWPALT